MQGLPKQNPNFFGANALCMQIVIPGAYVHEYHAVNGECLVLLEVHSETL